MAIDTGTDLHGSPRVSTLFPDPSGAKPPWWRRRRRALATVVVIALGASGLLAARAFGAANGGYRTATVTTRDVDAQLNGVATIEPVSQASVAFSTAGTVDSVPVKVGDSVSIGQTLATLDPEALHQALREQQAALAQAELALEQALNGEAVTGPGSGDNPVQLTAAPMPSDADRELANAQQAVLSAQHGVDAALHEATGALDSATTVCASAGVGGTPTTPPAAGAMTACQTATAAVLTAQAAVNDAQQKLALASRALDDLLAVRAAASSSPDTGTGSAATDSPAGSTGATGQSDGSATSPSAADLVAYQKAVDAAAAYVAVAEQAIARATIVSPIAGTVEAVTLAPGDAVDAAGSTTATIVVVGLGGYEATTTVSVDDVTDVEVGQQATLQPDGSKRSLAGTVSSISITPDADTATTSYRVVIGLDDPGADLDNGSTGSISIVTERARTGLAVPTSAVTPTGDRHVVTVLDGTTTERIPVEVGVIGNVWTEITDGLRAGQEVVLADLAEPLPGSATESSGDDPESRFPGGLNGGGGPPVFRFQGPPGQ